MLKRIWLVISVAWATLVIGLRITARNADLNWVATILIAALPWGFKVLGRYIRTGRWKRAY